MSEEGQTKEQNTTSTESNTGRLLTHKFSSDSTSKRIGQFLVQVYSPLRPKGLGICPNKVLLNWTRDLVSRRFKSSVMSEDSFNFNFN